MLEPTVKKGSRKYYSMRLSVQKALDKAVREKAKGTGWKFKDGVLFRQQADWFIDASPRVWPYEEKTTLQITIKPMALDPVFWDLVGLSENQEMPLSFRYFGVSTCNAPYFAELDLEEHADPTVLATRAIESADRRLKQLETYTINDFLASCRCNVGTRETYLTTLVTALVMLHHEQEALSMCEEAITQGLSGGFSAPAGTFFEMAAAWLRQSMSGTGAVRH